MSDEREEPRGPNKGDLDALKDGAAMLIQAGNRVAALSLLWSAIAIDPTDLAAHRRLAATLAHAGDLDGAAEEFARYVEFMLPLGDIGRASLELAYGANMIGGHPALLGAAEKIAGAVRALVPSTAPALAARTAEGAMVEAFAPTPLQLPRLLPKVPFRFCLHHDSDRVWMQLEGGTTDLVPDALRVVDGADNVVEERLCIPLAPGAKGHVPAQASTAGDPVAWVVVGLPHAIAAAYLDDRVWFCGFQARVGTDWLALDLVDSGCRLGRTQARSAS